MDSILLGALHAVLAGRLTVEQISALMSSNGAKRFGLYLRKGSITVGADADLIIVDLKGTTTLRKEELFTQARLCDRLYEGLTFQGRLERTLVRGRTVYQAGKVVGESGMGQFVRPDASSE